MAQHKILMVCLGNICRSPMAEGILRNMVQKQQLDVITDSAATSNYHIGDKADHRAVAAMKRHGIDISDLRGRQLQVEDFTYFDRIFAMDKSNLQNILAVAPSEELAKKVQLIMDLAPEHDQREVPDPYYGGDQSFENVHSMLVNACTNLITELK